MWHLLCKDYPVVVFIIIIDNIESFKVLYKIKLKPKIKEGIKRTEITPVVIKALITATTIKKQITTMAT